MASVRVKQVDAFTTIPHTGNPAGVVVEGGNLTLSQMQSIAREMNLSETAFIIPPTKPDADLRIRWFTPMEEASLCGPATIASFHSLAEEERMGMIRPGKYSYRLETESGILPVDVVKDAGSISVMMGLKVPALERAVHYKIDLLRVLNLSMTDFDNRIPIIRCEYLMVAVKRLHTLFTMKPNFLTMSIFLASRKLQGMCVFTTETVDRGSVVHSRFFAPNSGINEDPVTGATHAPLAVLLYDNGILRMNDGRCVFQGEQGDAIGRRGRVTVELLVEDNKPSSVKVGGNAVTVLEGDLLLGE